MHENPLALAAGAAVIGLALGMLLPETEPERQVMGATRDQLADRVSNVADRVKDAAVDAGREVKDTLQEQVSAAAPGLKSTLEDAAATVKDQIKESAGRVADEAKQEIRKRSKGRQPGERMGLKEGFALVRDSGKDFIEDDCPTQAAALSYYTIFSLPPLLVLILMILGALVDPQDIRGQLETQIGALMGPSATEQIRGHPASRPTTPGSGGAAPDRAQHRRADARGQRCVRPAAGGAQPRLGGGPRSAAGRAQGVSPEAGLFVRHDPERRVPAARVARAERRALGVRRRARRDAAGRACPRRCCRWSTRWSRWWWSRRSSPPSSRCCPMPRVAWRDVWVGAAVTAVLFVVGKFLIGLYLGRSNPGQAFGAAGSLAVMLVWIYYSSMILLFGAEFTQAWAEAAGRRHRPGARGGAGGAAEEGGAGGPAGAGGLSPRHSLRLGLTAE